MGWIYTVDHPAAAAHEGYVALVLDDGEETSEHSARTAGRVAGWRSSCDCGWHHPMILRAAGAAVGEFTAPPAAIDSSIYLVWVEHIRRDVPELHQAWMDRPGQQAPSVMEL